LHAKNDANTMNRRCERESSALMEVVLCMLLFICSLPATAQSHIHGDHAAHGGMERKKGE
jgi:hypothetical protein